MKALAVLGILIGVMAMLQFSTPDYEHEPDALVVATNYAIYRNAAFLHVLKHKPTGSVPTNALTLPTGWQALREWQTRVDTGRCYVFGPATSEEIDAAQQLFQGSFAIGRAVNGALTPNSGVSITIPAFVPNNSLVSIIMVE